MVRLLVALLCAQPSADVVPVLYVEPKTSVEFALTNTSDHPLTFVVRENGTVYGPEFGLIHDGKPVERVEFQIFEGPLASKEIQPGESLPCWMSLNHFYHSVPADNVDDSPQAPSLPRRGRRSRTTVKWITMGRYELIGGYKMGGKQVMGQAVTPLSLPPRQLAILEVGGSFIFNRDQDIYPVQAIVREKAEIELVPVMRVGPAARIELALVNMSDQPLTFAQDSEDNVVAGLEFSLHQDGEPLEKAPQRDTPPYVSRVVGQGEALRVSMTPAFFQPKPGRYEVVASYTMEAEQVEGVAVTPFEMPARVVAILEIEGPPLPDQQDE